MYDVKIKNFEGPLDLLLQLIEGEKLDITQISLAKITDEYINHINELDPKSYDVAEFLVIASKLIYIKSKAILPTFDNEEEEEEIEDLRKKLEEYKKYKEAAKLFHETLETGYRSFQRKNGPKFVLKKFTPPEGIDLGSLLNIFKDVLANIPEEEVAEKEEVFEKKISVEEKIFELKKFFGKKKKISFRDVLKQAKTKHEVVVSFLAVLDLIKQKSIEVKQDKNFGDIIISAIGHPKG